MSSRLGHKSDFPYHDHAIDFVDFPRWCMDAWYIVYLYSSRANADKAHKQHDEFQI